MHRYDPEKTKSDEAVIREIDNWKLSISRSKKRIYINTTEYHPFPLELSRDDLQGLLDAMDDMT